MVGVTSSARGWLFLRRRCHSSGTPMSQRSLKKTLEPARARDVRGAAPLGRVAPTIELEPDDEPTTVDTDIRTQAVEPAMSNRATRRDLDISEGAQTGNWPRMANARGEFSIPSIRGIPSNVVSGLIEGPDGHSRSPGSRHRDPSTPPVDGVHLARATRQELTVVVDDEQGTLSRETAAALARNIVTAFG